MKILKRNYGHRNLIIFLLLSLVYLESIASLSQGRSLFSLTSLKYFFIDNYIILTLTLMASFAVVKIKRYSEILLLVCLTTIVGKNFILLSGSFNKLVLGLNFIYLIFAFYFFVTWELEVAMASFNPLFTKNDLEKESRFPITAKINLENSEDFTFASITNLDEESCFLLLPADHNLTLNSSKKYLLETNYEGITFKHTAQLVSSYDRGIGLVFTKPENPRLSWTELYKVCLERGLMA